MHESTLARRILELAAARAGGAAVRVVHGRVAETETLSREALELHFRAYAGLVQDAQITPPTSQNQRGIEEDLLAMGPRLASLPLDQATRAAEHAVRNYDPCISCSTHFLTLKIEQRA